MGRIVLITGGARSGKSLFAEEIAKARGGEVVYIATAEPSDSEMETRIARHQAQRPPEWRTLEIPLDLRSGLDPADVNVRTVLVECLSLWVANRFGGLGDSEAEGWWNETEALEQTVKAEMQRVLDCARSSTWQLLLVTNEVGLSLHPNSAIGRAYQDVLGRLNQFVGRQADDVYLVVAGQAVNLKTLAAPRPYRED